MKKKRKISGKLPPFVALPWDILNGPAYKALSHSAAKALPYFFGKAKDGTPHRDPEWYSTSFTFSYKEAKSYGFSYSTFHQIICQVVEKGFIDPVDKGGLRGCSRSNSKFKPSIRWKKYGTQEFEVINWKFFQPSAK